MAPIYLLGRDSPYSHPYRTQKKGCTRNHFRRIMTFVRSAAIVVFHTDVFHAIKFEVGMSP
jgi:hypothetical protein